MTVKRLRRNGWALVGTVASDSTAETEYEIKRSPDGTLGCACMGWAIRKRCHHLDAWCARGPVMVGTPRGATRADFYRGIDAATRVVVAGETFTVRRAISFGDI